MTRAAAGAGELALARNGRRRGEPVADALNGAAAGAPRAAAVIAADCQRAGADGQAC